MKYIGFEVLNAEEMTRGDYNKFRGWQIPEDENPADHGCKVTREDGHVSWFPKATFDNMYRGVTGLTFGLAVEALKNSQKVCRIGWNGKGMWLGLIKGEDYAIHGLHPLAQLGRGTDIQCLPWIGMKTADDKFVPWLASQTDVLAEDWMIVE